MARCSSPRNAGGVLRTATAVPMAAVAAFPSSQPHHPRDGQAMPLSLLRSHPGGLLQVDHDLAERVTGLHGA